MLCCRVLGRDGKGSKAMLEGRGRDWRRETEGWRIEGGLDGKERGRRRAGQRRAMALTRRHDITHQSTTFVWIAFVEKCG